MATARQLPADWERELEVTYYDTVMEREYTRLVSRHASGDLVVRITDVQEPTASRSGAIWSGRVDPTRVYWR